MIDKIDDEAYAAGLAAFDSNKTVRQMVEPIIAAAEVPLIERLKSPAKHDRDDVAHFSALIGFLDGVLTRLRQGGGAS